VTPSRRLLGPLRRIGGQIALLSLFAMVLTAAIVSFIAAGLRDETKKEDFAQVGAFMTLAHLLGEVDPAMRPATVEATRRAFPHLDIMLLSEAPPERPGRGPVPMVGFLRDELGHGLRVIPVGDEDTATTDASPNGRRYAVAVEVAPQAYILARLPDLPPPPHFLQIGGVALFFGITLMVVVPWAAWWLGRPLARFARAATEFGLEAEHEPLPETGPDEIRLAARAFNAMRRRIADLVADRTRMLAAVGHDLRTPITRLRLRVEFLEAGEVKAALLKDLDHMHRLVEGALAFLKGGAAPVPRGAIDLSALVQTIADEFAELDRPVTAVVPDGRVVVIGRLDALQRALENLFENAVRYGGRADASLLGIGDVVTVEIADDGPGIALERQAEMLQPFVRGDEARGGVADGGLGLGLSITATIAAEHGGSLAFDRGIDGRFLVRLTLPRG
jgi:signal transduction histidine kinase